MLTFLKIWVCNKICHEKASMNKFSWEPFLLG
nr:MAG TPA: hypothetical protein [Caudoviricetes sp.]